MVDGTCSMGELCSIYPNELIGPDYPLCPVAIDSSLTFLIANTSDRDGSKICKFLGFKPLTKYRSNDSHGNRVVTVWGLEIHPDSKNEKAFIDRQIYAKAMRTIEGYRSNWRKFYAKQLVTKQQFIEAMTERMKQI
jgi:hypothetical protein